jgi:glycosyltransferase involved in cell wall biosynthesis
LVKETHRASQQPSPEGRALLTVVTPVYNEAENLPLLYERLCEVLDSLAGVRWEWFIVDDHSADGTFEAMRALAARDDRVNGVRFARNHGSHTAIMCGLEHAQGDCAVVLAGDLQDPPETIPALLERWRSGMQVVWAVRAHREGERASTVGFARLYYFLMQRLVGLNLPPSGADFFILDKQVIRSLYQFHERHISLIALITWMGFRQDFISYDKQARVHGRSGWSLEKKLKLVADSVTAFSYLPIRLMSYVGFTFAFLGMVYALVVACNALRGMTPQGWASLMIVMLVVGGVQMMMMGVLGEYVWRALDEARGRPRYIIEDTLK